MSQRGNGEGSISKRKDGRWYGRYTVEVAGVPKQKSVYGKTRAEASEKLNKAIVDAKRGHSPDAGTITVREHLDDWLTDCLMPKVAAGKLEHSSYVRYAGIVRNHIQPGLGHRKLKDLNRAEVRKLYNAKSKQLGPRSVDYLHVTLQMALKQAMRDELLSRNVADGERQRGSRSKEEAKAFSADQVKSLLAAAQCERNHALYVTAVHTGLRQGELLGLRWTDVELDGASSKVYVRHALKGTADGLALGALKNKASRRSVPLNKSATTALKEHHVWQKEEQLRATEWQDYSLVFPNRVGKPMDHNNLYHREYKPLLERVGLHEQGYTFHTLRHTFATELFRQGKRPKVIQTLLGHSSIVQTMDTYSHLLDGVDDDEVGGLDEAFG